MFNKSSYNVLVVLTVLAAITLIFGTAVSIAPPAPSAINASDWFERHPDAVNLSLGADLSDYYQRHPASLTAADTAGASDWFERHPITAPSAIGASDWFERHPVTAPSIPARPKDYAALKDAQLEQRDAEQFGNARVIVAGGEDSYLAMQKEQRAMQKELRAATNSASNVVSAPAISARSERYAALKDAQLEQKDAEQFGTATLSTSGAPAPSGCHLDGIEPAC